MLVPPAGCSVYPGLLPKEVWAKQARQGGCVGERNGSMEPARAADLSRWGL